MKSLKQNKISNKILLIFLLFIAIELFQVCLGGDNEDGEGWQKVEGKKTKRAKKKQELYPHYSQRYGYKNQSKFQQKFNQFKKVEKGKSNNIENSKEKIKDKNPKENIKIQKYNLEKDKKIKDKLIIGSEEIDENLLNEENKNKLEKKQIINEISWKEKLFSSPKENKKINKQNFESKNNLNKQENDKIIEEITEEIIKNVENEVWKDFNENRNFIKLKETKQKENEIEDGGEVWQKVYGKKAKKANNKEIIKSDKSIKSNEEKIKEDKKEESFEEEDQITKKEEKIKKSWADLAEEEE
uniref:Uncharacterized protein n=1 Tax=Meloidogyne hapla TaxID=6305 RepID=A0A1I8B7M7_MELHA